MSFDELIKSLTLQTAPSAWNTNGQIDLEEYNIHLKWAQQATAECDEEDKPWHTWCWGHRRSQLSSRDDALCGAEGETEAQGA